MHQCWTEYLIILDIFGKYRLHNSHICAWFVCPACNAIENDQYALQVNLKFTISLWHSTWHTSKQSLRYRLIPTVITFSNSERQNVRKLDMTTHLPKVLVRRKRNNKFPWFEKTLKLFLSLKPWKTFPCICCVVGHCRKTYFSLFSREIQPFRTKINLLQRSKQDSKFSQCNISSHLSRYHKYSCLVSWKDCTCLPLKINFCRGQKHSTCLHVKNSFHLGRKP